MSGVTLERLRWLLKGRTPGEWKVYKYWNGRLDVHSPTGEDDTCTSVITYPTAVDAELLALAPALGEALISSEACVEALTLERDRLAHELRLLREAVGTEEIDKLRRDLADERSSHAGTIDQRERAEAAADRLAYAAFGIDDIGEHTSVNCPWANAAELLEDCAGAVQEVCLGAPVEVHAPLSSDTPEWSGSDTFAGGEG